MYIHRQTYAHTVSLPLFLSFGSLSNTHTLSLFLFFVLFRLPTYVFDCRFSETEVESWPNGKNILKEYLKKRKQPETGWAIDDFEVVNVGKSGNAKLLVSWCGSERKTHIFESQVNAAMKPFVAEKKKAFLEAMHAL